MKFKRSLGAISGVLLILMLASGAQAATVVFDRTELRHRAEMKMSPLGPEMFIFQPVPSNFPANVLGVAEGVSDLSLFRVLDLGLSRLKASDEPVPAGAVLILVGLIALIALKGRRK
jgi:hypothetical protein